VTGRDEIDRAFDTRIEPWSMGCTGACDQGRRTCLHPERCAQDLPFPGRLATFAIAVGAIGAWALLASLICASAR
jgi:hypothetical protein